MAKHQADRVARSNPGPIGFLFARRAQEVDHDSDSTRSGNSIVYRSERYQPGEMVYLQWSMVLGLRQVQW